MNNAMPKPKHTGGFTLSELLIAFAMFSIVISVILVSLVQAGQNMRFSQSFYTDHLLAQGLMLEMRDAIVNGNNPQTAAYLYATTHDVYAYRLWVNGMYDFGSDNSPINFVTAGNTLYSGGVTIVAVIWDDSGNITGRAVGFVID